VLFPQDQLVQIIELSAGIWNATRSQLETRLRPLQMTWPQYGVLLALRGGESLTQRDIGECLEIDRTTVSVICDSLERHGWAERRSDPADRRANRVQITETGKEIVAQAEPIVFGAYAAIADVLSPAEIAGIAPKLERVHQALKSVPKDHPQPGPVSAENGG
jgi:MarR family transcriptional regulator for hemolysin